MAETQFYQHLKRHGGMHRQNPELVRLSDATGFTIDHLFKVATRKRAATTKCAKAIAQNAQAGAVTVSSFGVEE